MPSNIQRVSLWMNTAHILLCSRDKTRANEGISVQEDTIMKSQQWHRVAKWQWASSQVKWSLVPLARKRKKEKKKETHPYTGKRFISSKADLNIPSSFTVCVCVFSETDVNIYNGFFPFRRLLSAHYLLLPVSRLPGLQSRGIKYDRASSKGCHRTTKKHKNPSHTGQKGPASFLLLPHSPPSDCPAPPSILTLLLVPPSF